MTTSVCRATLEGASNSEEKLLMKVAKREAEAKLANELSGTNIRVLKVEFSHAVVKESR